ncbi:DUF2471 family protein [Massilia sp. 9096]|uniref:DUF2471 family protein n=1 Tax=Massilia sp. 9096 TaxID=1500894 RepID=UPI0009DFF3A4|nr:DUF2471 family protein [Massilia sp. 9096]
MLDESFWDELTAVGDAARRAVPEIVSRYRHEGVLTWSLLHEIEAEVLAELRALGKYEEWILNMIRAAPVLGYPTDDRPVSFANAGVVPIIFKLVEKAWKLVH